MRRALRVRGVVGEERLERSEREGRLKGRDCFGREGLGRVRGSGGRRPRRADIVAVDAEVLGRSRGCFDCRFIGVKEWTIWKEGRPCKRACLRSRECHLPRSSIPAEKLTWSQSRVVLSLRFNTGRSGAPPKSQNSGP